MCQLFRAMCKEVKKGWRKVSGVISDKRVAAREGRKRVVRPVMSFSLETVEKKRQEAELKMLRFSLGVMVGMRNENIRGTAQV